MTSPPDWIIIGVVAAPHGIRGEIRVTIETDFPERFVSGNTLTLLLPDADSGERNRPNTSRAAHPAPGTRMPRQFLIDKARSHKGAVLLKLHGIDDRDSARRLQGTEIVVGRDEVKALPPDTWYIFDVEGLDVFTRAGVHLGVVEEVLQPGGNDVYVVRKGRRETLLPAIKPVILEVDRDARRMVVNPPEELRDEK